MLMSPVVDSLVHRVLRSNYVWIESFVVLNLWMCVVRQVKCTVFLGTFDHGLAMTALC